MTAIVAERVRLQYHATTFRLLGEEPVLSRWALRRIEAAERRCGRRLPASVREWYALKTADKPLRERQRYHCQAFASLTSILKDFKDSPRSQDEYTANRLIVVSSDASYSVRLNGSDDPPVDLDPDQAEWGLQYSHFSEFVFWFIIGELTMNFVLPRPGEPCLCLEANDPSFGPIGLDFFKEHYDEGPPQSYLVNQVHTPSHAFFSTDTWIWVTKLGFPPTEDKPWYCRLVAASEEALYRVAKKLWRCGSLSQTLQARGEPARRILDRVRDEAHSL